MKLIIIFSILAWVLTSSSREEGKKEITIDSYLSYDTNKVRTCIKQRQVNLKMTLKNEAGLFYIKVESKHDNFIPISQTVDTSIEGDRRRIIFSAGRYGNFHQRYEVTTVEVDRSLEALETLEFLPNEKLPNFKISDEDDSIDIDIKPISSVKKNKERKGIDIKKNKGLKGIIKDIGEKLGIKDNK
jgi:hypothetical protein